MIGKTSIGRSFGGIVKYLLDEKKQAEILEADGVNYTNQESIISDFNAHRKLSPNLGKAVWHSSISFSESDNLSPEQMKEVATDFIKEMGLDNSQYLIIQHNDTDHRHLHILANRVDYEGKAVSDSHSKRKTKDRCDKLNKKYGLLQTKDMKNDRKEEIKKTILEGIAQGKPIGEVLKGVEKLGYEVKYNQASTGKISGVSYKNEEKGIIYKASEIDRNLSYTKMLQAIEQREIQQRMEKSITKKPGQTKGFTR